MSRRWSTVVRLAVQGYSWGWVAAEKSRPEPRALLHDRLKRGIWNETGSSISTLAGSELRAINAFRDLKLVDLEFPEEERQNIVKEKDKWKHQKWKFLEIPCTFANLWSLPFHSKPVILERKCYRPILEIVKDLHPQSVVLMGSPGIGKSGFILYTLWHFLSQEEKGSWGLVVLKFHTNPTYFVFSQSGGMQTLSSSMAVYRRVQSCQKPVWYLADWQIETSLYSLRCRKLLFCSPEEDNYRMFAKSSRVSMVYVPVWTLEELLALNHMAYGFEPKIIESRYQKYGGIPRYVLEEDEDKVVEDVDSGVKMAVNELISTRSLAISNLVYKLEVDPSYRRCTVQFTSKHMAKLVSQLTDITVLHSIFMSQPGTASVGMQSDLFDACFHQYWCSNNGRFRYRRMELCTETLKWVNLKEDIIDTNFGLVEWPMKSSTRVKYPKFVDREHMEVTMYKPQSKYHEGWDALVGRQVIQTTISGKRKLEWDNSLKKAKAFLERFMDRHKLTKTGLNWYS